MVNFNNPRGRGTAARITLTWTDSKIASITRWTEV